MLVITQHKGDEFYLLINDEIIATIKYLKPITNQIIVGIEANDGITILRKKVYDRLKEKL